ncbi:alcohol oxidase [Mycena rosella]|uniref:Alcohol oxidase n=1 Tax=Mycena rosella TaxID=1033263 RepID=A0AAD7D7V8_MYCRO|nr:alcohol oxidase [Mycena rosella]
MFFGSPYPLTPLETASVDDHDSSGQSKGIYDYIIIGGGTAGCVLANRLSKNPALKVLLLERGDARTGWATRVPLMSTNFMGDESAAYRWPAAHPVGDSRLLSLVTGKGLGGGSSINSMQYTRGSPAEYNRWSESGRQGWSYAEIEPYFKRSENFVNAPVATEHHGTQGEWSVRDMGELYFPAAKSCVDACAALGLPFCKDINDPAAPLTACAKLDCTIDAKSYRNSTFSAFLPSRLAEERKSHLHICTGAAVTALDLEVGPNGQKLARGVSFQANETGSKILHARARREVILCAGAIATPQILLLSGIGPKDKVKQPLMAELPGVGQNLQDHMAMGIMYGVPTDQSLHIIQTSRLRAIVELFRYIAFGEGLFLSPVTQLSILVDSNLIDESGHILPRTDTEPANLPDLELMPVHFNYSDPPIPIEAGVLSLKVGLMRPRSRGTVALASDDPLHRPACDLAFLTDPADLAVMRKGIRLAKRIGEKMRELGTALKDLYMPDSESDADLDAFIRKTVRTTYHYGCTCRMAPESDAGVVDDELRVHGIQNLRIADCSVLPEMMSTHLQAPVVMIAERCADMILSPNA